MWEVMLALVGEGYIYVLTDERRQQRHKEGAKEVRAKRSI